MSRRDRLAPAYHLPAGGDGVDWFDEHWSCRAGVRRRSHLTLQIDDVGFRIARSGGH